MASDKKAEREAALMEIRLLIAYNIKRLMEAVDGPMGTAAGLAKQAGIARRTVNRLLNPEHPSYKKIPPTLESLQAVSAALHQEVWALLLPTRQARVKNQSQDQTLERSAQRNAGRQDKAKNRS